MTFDQEFPNAKHHDQHNIDGDEVLHWHGNPDSCCMCKTPCQWVSISFEVAVCSRKCLGELWEEYPKASLVDTTRLSERDFDFFCESIENPAEPTEALRRLMQTYPRKTSTRIVADKTGEQ
jgi:hypothetical protein